MRRALGAVAILCLIAVPVRGEVVVSDGRYAMGTVLEITLTAPDTARGRALLDDLYAITRDLERVMTRFDPTSDLSRLNRAAGQGAQRVDPELGRLLAQSIELTARTRGAFDVSVGPLVALWTEAARTQKRPSAEAISAARAHVGPGVLRFEAPDRIALAAGAAIDLGGVAKGDALDRMAERVRAAGIRSALFSFGQSSLWAIGKPADADGWRLLVRRPDGGFAGVATLRDRAVSVSGSLGQWTEIEGRRYGHVIDPRSGEPLIRPLEAMVLCGTATVGEAASKALLVLGEQEGVELLEQLGCEGLLVGAGSARRETPGWKAAARFEEMETAESPQP